MSPGRTRRPFRLTTFVPSSASALMRPLWSSMAMIFPFRIAIAFMVEPLASRVVIAPL